MGDGLGLERFQTHVRMGLIGLSRKAMMPTRIHVCVCCTFVLLQTTLFTMSATAENWNDIESCTSEMTYRDVTPMQHWSGIIDDEELLERAPEFIVNEDDWVTLWNEWRGNDPVPEIDFTNDLIIVATSEGPNEPELLSPEELGPCQSSCLTLSSAGDIRLFPICDSGGGPGFGYIMVRVSREGVTTVAGCDCNLSDDDTE